MPDQISNPPNSTNPEDLSKQNPVDPAVGSDNIASLSATEGIVVQGDLPSSTKKTGPFNHPEANELYRNCLKSGDSPREAKAQVRRAGY